MSHHLPTAVVFALRLDGQGGAEKLVPGSALPAEDVWMHLDYSSPHAYEWIKTSPLLPDGVRDSLQGDSSRPKLVKANGGMLLTLRCINATEGYEADIITESKEITLRGTPEALVACHAVEEGRDGGPQPPPLATRGSAGLPETGAAIPAS